MKVKYKQRLLLRCIHNFMSDYINNMDHMRISGTEPSSVILSRKLTSYDRLAFEFIAPWTNCRTWLARENSMFEALWYRLMWQAQTEKVPRYVQRAESEKSWQVWKRGWSQQEEHMQVPKGRDQVP